MTTNGISQCTELSCVQEVKLFLHSLPHSSSHLLDHRWLNNGLVGASVVDLVNLRWEFHLMNILLKFYFICGPLCPSSLLLLSLSVELIPFIACALRVIANIGLVTFSNTLPTLCSRLEGALFHFLVLLHLLKLSFSTFLLILTALVHEIATIGLASGDTMLLNQWLDYLLRLSTNLGFACTELPIVFGCALSLFLGTLL